MMIDKSLFTLIQVQNPEESETLTEHDAQLAQQILHHHPANMADDAFLIMASANLINAYVKQNKDPNDEYSYAFKRRVADLVETWSKAPLDGVSVSRYHDVTYVSIDPLQFSFHHLQAEPSILPSLTEDPWVKLRLQPYARRILLSTIRHYNLCDAELANQLKALSDVTRLKIFNQAKKQEICACDLIKDYNLTQPTLSFHMKTLIQCGLLIPRKDGKWVKYRINHFALMKLKQLTE